MNIWRVGISLFVLLIATQSSGCSMLRSIGLLPSTEAAAPAVTAPAKVPLSEQRYEFTLVLSAARDVNPDPQARPSPIRTRIFLAEANAGVNDLPFETIFQFDGGDLDPAPVATVTLQPGESKRIKLIGVKTQNTVTIAAAYRDPYSSNWIITKTIEPDNAIRLNAELGSASVIFASR